MKIVIIIARVLLGIIFLVFGLNGFLHFIPMGPAPTGMAGQFLGVLFASHYASFIFLVQAVVGVLLLLNLFVPLALLFIAPVIVNILLFHILMNPSGIGPGALATVLWFIVAYGMRSAFAGVLRK